jgi:integrase
MAKVLDSLQQLPDGSELVRWHLLDDNYQLIKPVEQFLRFKQLGGATVGTLKTYAEKLKAFWKYLELKELDWADFKVRHMAEFGYWYLTGLLLDEKSVAIASEEMTATRSKRTVNLALTVVTQFYEFHTSKGTLEDKHLREERLPRGAQRRGLLAGYLKQSPVGVKKVRYREPQKLPSCLTPEQIRTLINACRTARDRLILWLLADTGMRIGELLGLHWCDFNWKARTLKIVRRDNPNQAYAKGQERELSIADLLRQPEFCAILSQYSDEEYPHDVVERLGHNLVFVVLHQGSPSYGQPLTAQNVNKLLERLQEKTEIEIERVYPHLFRHTFATHNIREARRKGKEKEEIAKTVQRQLGHQSIATTLDIYDHSFNEAELAQALERIVKDQ